VGFRTALTALPLALVLAAPASAAEVSVGVAPANGVRLGNAIQVTGRVTQDALPLAGREVRLEVRRHPFTGPWRTRGSATTTADGGYAFAPELDRNHRVRVRLVGALPVDPAVAPEPDTLSARRSAYVLPAFTLRFEQRGERAIRITQTYTVPRDVRLSAPTRFYVGRRGAKVAPLRATARTRRARRGRYVARARVRIPASYDGRFAYVSCFGYSKRSGMGDPDLRCPHRSVTLAQNP
jgi:hypothetical protein